MENFVVAQEAAVVAKRKRITHPPDRIAQAVSLGRHVGATSAVLTLNKKLPAAEQLTAGTIDSWLCRFKKEGKFWENMGKRGRTSVMDCVPGVRNEWEKQVASFRAQGSSVTARLSSTIVTAVLEEKAPSLLARHGGHLKVSVTTGQKALAASGMSWRKKSSSRILPPIAELAESRDDFYKSLHDCFPGVVVDRHLVINFDQTFHQYNPTRGYTWEKKGSGRVQLTDSKDGFTLLPVISVAGVVGAQMIFPGTTSLSFPSVPPGPLLRYTHTNNHWSNEKTTIELFKTIIFPHIAARRAVLDDVAAPVIVLADAFSAHWTPAVRALVAKEDAVAYIAVPDSLTHLFQPLDLGVIAAIKQSVLRRKDEFAEQEIRTAIQENRAVMLSKSRPVLRHRTTLYIKECLADPSVCAERCCRTGFDRAGITRVLYGNTDVLPDVDNFIPPTSCDECGEFALARDDTPDCQCFADGHSALLCEQCFENHNMICVPAA